MPMSRITEVTCEKLLPFIFLFGMYIAMYGHLTPGGGFQGGVILGAGIILLFFSHGLEKTNYLVNYTQSHKVEMWSGILILLIALSGVFLGFTFLTNYLSIGKPGSLNSGGYIPLLNLLIGAKVGAGIIVMFHAFLKVGQ
jgi:multicomponent Na+:H+ antiporter subunit B